MPRLEDWIHLGRPLDPGYSTNRAIGVVAADKIGTFVHLSLLCRQCNHGFSKVDDAVVDLILTTPSLSMLQVAARW